MSLVFDVLGAGISAPGLPDWPALEAAFAGRSMDGERSSPPSGLLSARERRRAPAAVKLSFAAAEEACAMAGLRPAEPIAIFSSGMGDLDITDYMCRTLTDQPELLSPTRFHNSVHNAASGYWSIGAGATGDVTAISGWRDSATIGLVDAISRLGERADQPVLLVVYDDVAHEAMRDLWPSGQSFCGALVIQQTGARQPLARLRAHPHRGPDRHPELPQDIARRISDNPAARLLPLFGLIAGGLQGDVALGAEQGPGLVLERL